MHPAFSVIFFTVFSGVGYGLLAVLGVFVASGVLPPVQWLGILGLGFGFAAVTAGLLSSTVHLGHPERAWRAFSQWRSSWLSREGIVSVLTFGPILLLALAWLLPAHAVGTIEIWAVMTAIGAALSVASTGMIYQSLKTIHQWHNHFTVPNYLLLGAAGGAVWLNAIVTALGFNADPVAVTTLTLLGLAWLSKWAYWRLIDTTTHQSTAESATGLGRFGKVSRFEDPHTEQNYLLKEMGYQIAQRHAVKLRYYAKALTFALPLVLVALSDGADGVVSLIAAGVAVVSVTSGLLIERWLFFAEAKHVVTLYYGARSA